MLRLKSSYRKLAAIISLSLLLSGCSMFSPAKKPEIGPAGKPVETKPNPPLTERFTAPPKELYDLEATAGVIFEGIVNGNWAQSESGLNTLQQLWPQIKNQIGDKKGVKEADGALEKLVTNISGHKNADSYESLNKFMANISDIGKSYKLSPLSDIVAVGNTIRNVSFYSHDMEWKKAQAKMKELEGTWGQTKPSMEKIGILSETTKAHSSVKQLKDAVEAENKGSVEENIANINESMANIREYYKGK